MDKNHKTKAPSPKDAFLLKISESKIPALMKLAMVRAERKMFDALFFNDEDATPWQKGIEKDYVIAERYDLSDEYSHICEVELRDYGHEIGAQDAEASLSRAVNGTHRELFYGIDRIDIPSRKVFLRGSVYGEVAHLDHNGWQVVLDIAGVEKSNEEKLTIFQALLLEAYTLESQENYKLALFTYFSALESLVTVTLEKFAQSIPSELHYALEHLSLDDKVRVAVRTQEDPPLELANIKIWASLMEELSVFKEVRNNIAHARHQYPVSQEQVNGGFFCICVLHAFFTLRLDNFNDIRKAYYVKNALPKDFGRSIDIC